MSDRQLSMLATGSTDTVRNIRRGSIPRADTLEALCSVLELGLHVGPPRGPEASTATGPIAPPSEPPPPASPLPDLRVFSPKVDMPVRGWATCSIVGYLEDETTDHLDAPAPVHLPDETAFYALALGASMRPEGIDNGDYCLVSPGAPLEAGWRVWLKNRQQQVTIKRLVEVTDKTYRLRGWQDPDRRRRQAPYDDEWIRSNVAEAGVVLAVYRGAPSRTHPPELIPDPKPPGAETSRGDATARSPEPRGGAGRDHVLDALVRELRALREEQAALRELVARLAPDKTPRPMKRRRR